MFYLWTAYCLRTRHTNGLICAARCRNTIQYKTIVCSNTIDYVKAGTTESNEAFQIDRQNSTRLYCSLSLRFMCTSNCPCMKTRLVNNFWFADFLNNLSFSSLLPTSSLVHLMKLTGFFDVRWFQGGMIYVPILSKYR